MTIGFWGGKLCVEKLQADALQALLHSPVAVLLRSHCSKPRAPRLAKSVRSHSQAPGAHPAMGKTC